MSRIARLFAPALTIRGGQSGIQPMEGMRGLAVLLVFFVHYVTLAKAWVRPDSFTFAVASDLFNVGNAGVDLFFVLSGYLIYRMLITKTTPLPQYAVRRLRRIYPAFLAVLALYLVLAVWFPAERALPQGWNPLSIYIAQNVLLLPGLFPIPPIITVSWSLSYEVFYYLAVPLLIVALRLRTWTSARRLVLLVALTVAGFALFQWRMEHMRLLMFLSGMILFELLHHGTRTVPGAGLVAFAAALAGMIAFREARIGETWRVLLLFVSFLALCLDAFGNRLGITGRLLTWAPARALGNISYSYYLIHGLTLKAAFMIVGAVYPPHVATPLFWVLLLPMFAATIVPAFCLFTLVERPFSIEYESAPRPAAAHSDRAPRLSTSPVRGLLTDPAA